MRHSVVRLRSLVAPAVLGLGLVVLPACDGTQRRAGADSLAVLATKLKDAEQASRDREAIVNELAQTTKLLEEIDGEVSKVKGLKLPARKAGAAAQDPWAARNDSLVGKVKGVAALLAKSRARVDELSRKNGAQAKEIATYRSTIASLEALTERQTGEIITLTAANDSLRFANGMLAIERDQERETVRGLRDTVNTVFYVVGTKEELIKRGVVAEDGRKRFVVFGSRGLVPARKLNRAAFTRADMRQPIEIPLKAAGQKFHVVSRHDAGLLDLPAEEGKAADRVRVKEPSEFWAPSRYLIIVTQG
jgi:hypothetical protein